MKAMLRGSRRLPSDASYEKSAEPEASDSEGKAAAVNGTSDSEVISKEKGGDIVREAVGEANSIQKGEQSSTAAESFQPDKASGVSSFAGEHEEESTRGNVHSSKTLEKAVLNERVEESVDKEEAGSVKEGEINVTHHSTPSDTTMDQAVDAPVDNEDGSIPEGKPDSIASKIENVDEVESISVKEGEMSSEIISTSENAANDAGLDEIVDKFDRDQGKSGEGKSSSAADAASDNFTSLESPDFDNSVEKSIADDQKVKEGKSPSVSTSSAIAGSKDEWNDNEASLISEEKTSSSTTASKSVSGTESVVSDEASNKSNDVAEAGMIAKEEKGSVTSEPENSISLDGSVVGEVTGKSADDDDSKPSLIAGEKTSSVTSAPQNAASLEHSVVDEVTDKSGNDDDITKEAKSSVTSASENAASLEHSVVDEAAGKSDDDDNVVEAGLITKEKSSSVTSASENAASLEDSVVDEAAHKSDDDNVVEAELITKEKTSSVTSAPDNASSLEGSVVDEAADKSDDDDITEANFIAEEKTSSVTSAPDDSASLEGSVVDEVTGKSADDDDSKPSLIAEEKTSSVTSAPDNTASLEGGVVDEAVEKSDDDDDVGEAPSIEEKASSISSASDNATRPEGADLDEVPDKAAGGSAGSSEEEKSSSVASASNNVTSLEGSVSDGDIDKSDDDDDGDESSLIEEKTSSITSASGNVTSLEGSVSDEVVEKSDDDDSQTVKEATRSEDADSDEEIGHSVENGEAGSTEDFITPSSGGETHSEDAVSEKVLANSVDHSDSEAGSTHLEGANSTESTFAVNEETNAVEDHVNTTVKENVTDSSGLEHSSQSDMGGQDDVSIETTNHSDLDAASNKTDQVLSEASNEINSSDSKCRDDPTFMYKDLEGYDCDYIKANKPGKCQKLHNGIMIGITSCPESCGMVDKCLQFDFGSTGNGANATALEIDAAASNATVDEGSIQNITGNLLDHDTEISSSNITSIEEDSTVEEKQSVDASSNVTDKESLKEASNCLDDPTFMYKDKEGYDCNYIKANKPEKCQKLHNGIMIGITSCPESCGMVDKCLEFDSGSTGNVANATALEIDDVTDVDISKASTEMDLVDGAKTTSSATDTLEQDPSENELISTAGTETESLKGASKCRDDPTFMYKDQEGYDCHYMAANMPEKCQNQHNGRMIGIAFCPESCAMVGKCLEFNSDSSGVIVDETSAGVGSTAAVTTHEASTQSIEETSTEYNNDITSDGNEKQPANTSSTAIITKSSASVPECRDDQTFMYKDLEGYDCNYIKANKPEKCQKLHNGIMVGITSCPESCGMVDECLEFHSANTDETVMEISSTQDTEVENGSDSVADEQESGSSTMFKTTAPTSFGEDSLVQDKQSMNLPSSAADNVTAKEPDSNNEFEHDVNKVEGSSNGTIIEETQSGDISMKADNGTDALISSNQNEIDKFGGQWEVLEEKTDSDLNLDIAKQMVENEIESELKNNNTSWSGLTMGDDAANANMGYDDRYGYDDEYGTENGYEYNSNFNWNNNENGGGFASEKVDWNANENNMYSESSSVNWNENQGYEQNVNAYNEPSDASWNQATQGSEQNWNTPSNYQQENYNRNPAETWDDDEDGFPVGIMLLFLILLAGFLYSRKNRQSRASQGGYQRLEQPMYMNKRS